MINTESAFRPPYKVSPVYRGKNIENFFYNYWNKTNIQGVKRTYLPIFWTSYYLKHGWPVKGRPRPELRAFIQKITKNQFNKFFTIVQNDDGILEPLPNNVLVFGAGGIGDIPIPLIKQQQSFVQSDNRDILVSFVGELETHPVRKLTCYAFATTPGFYSASKVSIKDFFKITKRSVFTLCPRGYGRTSFRLYEAMSVGSIPIYVWDHVEWLPYQGDLNWDDFSISINIKRIHELPDILKSYTPEMIKEKQKNIRKLYQNYFTLKGTCEQIIKMLNEEQND